MEQVIFAEAIWRAFAQCFLTHDEAVQAIDDYGLGLLHNAKSEPTSAALSREVGSTDGLDGFERRKT